MKENIFYRHEFKLQLYGGRIKHLTTPNQTSTFYFNKAIYDSTNQFNC